METKRVSIRACGFFGLAFAALAQRGPQDNFVLEPDLKFGTSGSSAGQLASPLGLAANADFIYVADSGNHRIQVFTTAGSYTNGWGSSGSADGKFSTPSGVAFGDDKVYVADRGNNRVQVFTTNGVFLSKWGAAGSGSGQFSGLRGIAVDADNVYVTETGNHRVQVFTKAGAYVRQWGSQGSVLGQFNEPQGVAVDQHYVYVVDVYNYRVQVFEKDGTFVRSWSLPSGGVVDGNSQYVEGICVDTRGVYVCYGFRANAWAGWTPTIVAYDKFGNVLWKWSRSFDGNAVFLSGAAGPFTYPCGIAAVNSMLYVCDYAGRFVQPIRRIYRTLGPLQPNPIPLADVWSVAQRSGTSVLDIDYLVTDENDPAVTAYAVAFAVESNAVPSLSTVVPMRTFIDGTAANVGTNVATGVGHRLSWDMGTDGLTNKISQWGNVQVSVLVKDQRGLLDLHFLSLPAIGSHAAFTISRSALTEGDFLPLWFWWLGAGDTNVALSAGQVVGVGGAFGGQVLASGTNTTAAGRAFIFSRLNLREATADELTAAREGTTPGTVLQWSPRREPPAADAKVNALNFVTYPTNGWWCVPLAL